MGIGDWGLGIGDWPQSPIPNPQSPIPNPQLSKFLLYLENFEKKLKLNFNLFTIMSNNQILINYLI